MAETPYERLIRDLEPGETGATEPYPDWRSRLAQQEASHPPLVPFEAKGRANLLKGYAGMRHNYAARAEAAKAGYGGLPFGPRTKAAYRAGMETAPESYREKIITSHEKKWAARWIEGVSR